MSTNADNRSVTLRGQNKILAPSGIEIFRHEMGYYYLDHAGVHWQRQTLTELCQVFVKHLIDFRSPGEVESNG